MSLNNIKFKSLFHKEQHPNTKILQQEFNLNEEEDQFQLSNELHLHLKTNSHKKYQEQPNQKAFSKNKTQKNILGHQLEHSSYNGQNFSFSKQLFQNLALLNKDKQKYLQKRQSFQQRQKLHKQENKYQKYILDQLNFKNKLMAIVGISKILQHSLFIGATKRSFFVSMKENDNKYQKSQNKKQSQESSQHNQQKLILTFRQEHNKNRVALLRLRGFINVCSNIQRILKMNAFLKIKYASPVNISNKIQVQQLSQFQSCSNIQSNPNKSSNSSSALKNISNLRKNKSKAKKLSTDFNLRSKNKIKSTNLISQILIQDMNNYDEGQGKNITRSKENSFIFSQNEFSCIKKDTLFQTQLSGIRNIEEIDSNFFIEKEFNLNKVNRKKQQQLFQLAKNKTQRQQRYSQEVIPSKNLQIKVSQKIIFPQSLLPQDIQYIELMKSIQKFKSQSQMMRNLLIQKNQELKKKDYELRHAKQQYQKKLQQMYDQLNSKAQNQMMNSQSQAGSSQQKSNQSAYYKQIQTALIGDRNFNQPKKNQQKRKFRHSNSRSDILTEQLIQKYMKQVFLLRQKMDLARQLCQQFEPDLRTQEGQILLEIIKLLTPQQRLNVMVD